jgi:hypothetical protein
MTEQLALAPWPFIGRTEEARRLEAFDTPPWCCSAILHYELMTHLVLDPCCGHGALSEPARLAGYSVQSLDIADWGYGEPGHDFLYSRLPHSSAPQTTVLMNPPFSLACLFVKRAWMNDVRKIVCFQRWPWWESKGRTAFWDAFPPNRIYVCRERATCWRFDIPPEQRIGGTPTSHAFYVWERNQPPGTLVGHLDRIGP